MPRVSKALRDDKRHEHLAVLDTSHRDVEARAAGRSQVFREYRQGALFKNDKKEKPSHPDYPGDATIRAIQFETVCDPLAAKDHLQQPGISRRLIAVWHGQSLSWRRPRSTRHQGTP